jgi:hypothetical protein
LRKNKKNIKEEEIVQIWDNPTKKKKIKRGK